MDVTVHAALLFSGEVRVFIHHELKGRTATIENLRNREHFTIEYQLLPSAAMCKALKKASATVPQGYRSASGEKHFEWTRLLLRAEDWLKNLTSIGAMSKFSPRPSCGNRAAAAGADAAAQETQGRCYSSTRRVG
jgi:hypothetical protein